jgi:hypothetical protein
MTKKSNHFFKPTYASRRKCPNCSSSFSDSRSYKKHLKRGSHFCNPQHHVAPTANVVGPPVPAPPDSEMAMFARVLPVQEDDDGSVADFITGDQEYEEHPVIMWLLRP